MAKKSKKGEHVAVKIIKKSEVIRQKQVEHVMAEVAIMSSIKHPLIVRLDI